MVAGFSGILHSEQYPATVATQCVMVVIPEGEEYLRLLAALLDIPGTPDSYDEPDSAQTDGLCFAWDEAYFLTDWLDCGEPPGDLPMNTSEVLFPATAIVTQGNAHTQLLNIAQRLATYYQQNPPAQFDTWNWQRFLAAGNYAYRLTGVKTATSAIATLQVRPHPTGTAVLSVTHDFYAAANTFNSVFTGTFTIPTSGNWDIVLAATSKNASSTNYNIPITVMEIWRTS